MATKAEITGVVVSDKMDKSVVVAVQRQIRDARCTARDTEADVEVPGAQRGQRREDRRPRRDRRGPADEPAQALGRDPRRRESQGDLSIADCRLLIVD